MSIEIGHGSSRGAAGSGVPMLTHDLPGIGGVIRQRPEDFLVDEVPMYEPCGEGEHAYLLLQKRELTTMAVARIVASHFRVPLSAVGYAGLKDKLAITRQMLSVHIPGRHVNEFPPLEHERVSVLGASMHTNKLRRGHLRSNRFSIRIRSVQPTDALVAARVLRRLASQGLPNAVGPQRFGSLGTNHLVGLAMVQGRWDDAAAELVGLPTPAPAACAAPTNAGASSGPSEDVIAGRTRSDWQSALDRMPIGARAERRVLLALLAGKGAERAMRSVTGDELGFYISAMQSSIFNHVLARRIASGMFEALVQGDVAHRFASGRDFAVDEQRAADAALQADNKAMLVSATGPMWGPAMVRAQGEIDELERTCLAHAGLSLDHLPVLEALAASLGRGDRRPVRVPLTDPDVEGGVDEHGPYVRVAFELPKGSFATTALREIMKSDEAESVGPAAEGESEGESGPAHVRNEGGPERR